MEPWMQEQLLQLRRMRQDRQVCACCQLPIETERFLPLDVFGLVGCACSRCVDRHMRWCDLWEEGVG